MGTLSSANSSEPAHSDNFNQLVKTQTGTSPQYSAEPEKLEVGPTLAFTSLFQHLREYFASPDTGSDILCILFRNWTTKGIYARVIPESPDFALEPGKYILDEPLEEGSLRFHIKVPADYPGGKQGFFRATERLLATKNIFGIKAVYLHEVAIDNFLSSIRDDFKIRAKSAGKNKGKGRKGKALKWKNPFIAFGCRLVWARDLCTPERLYLRIRCMDRESAGLVVVDTNDDAYKIGLDSDKNKFINAATPQLHLQLLIIWWQVRFRKMAIQHLGPSGVHAVPEGPWWWSIIHGYHPREQQGRSSTEVTPENHAPDNGPGVGQAPIIITTEEIAQRPRSQESHRAFIIGDPPAQAITEDHGGEPMRKHPTGSPNSAHAEDSVPPLSDVSAANKLQQPDAPATDEPSHQLQETKNRKKKKKKKSKENRKRKSSQTTASQFAEFSETSLSMSHQSSSTQEPQNSSQCLPPGTTTPNLTKPQRQSSMPTFTSQQFPALEAIAICNNRETSQKLLPSSITPLSTDNDIPSPSDYDTRKLPLKVTGSESQSGTSLSDTKAREGHKTPMGITHEVTVPGAEADSAVKEPVNPNHEETSHEGIIRTTKSDAVSRQTPPTTPLEKEALVRAPNETGHIGNPSSVETQGASHSYQHQPRPSRIPSTSSSTLYTIIESETGSYPECHNSESELHELPSEKDQSMPASKSYTKSDAVPEGDMANMGQRKSKNRKEDKTSLSKKLEATRKPPKSASLMMDTDIISSQNIPADSDGSPSALFSQGCSYQQPVGDQSGWSIVSRTKKPQTPSTRMNIRKQVRASQPNTKVRPFIFQGRRKMDAKVTKDADQLKSFERATSRALEPSLPVVSDADFPPLPSQKMSQKEKEPSPADVQEDVQPVTPAQHSASVSEIFQKTVDESTDSTHNTHNTEQAELEAASLQTDDNVSSSTVSAQEDQNADDTIPAHTAEIIKQREITISPPPRSASSSHISQQQRPVGLFWQLDSHGFPCAHRGCERRCCSWDGASVICPKCGPFSEIRYCGEEHLYADVKAHWPYCGQYTFQHSCRENTIPDHQKEGPPMMPCLHNWETPERHRQAVRHATDRTGDYFIFSDWADLMAAGQLPDSLDLRCSNRVVWVILFDNPEMKDRFRRVLGVCLFASIEIPFLVGYLFRMIRDDLRMRGVWDNDVDTALRYQMKHELGLDLLHETTGRRHACETDWNGRSRNDCPDLVCRSEYGRLLGDRAMNANSDFCRQCEIWESNFWIIRATRITHPTVTSVVARTCGEGSDRVLDMDRRLFHRGEGWDGYGTGPMEIEDN